MECPLCLIPKKETLLYEDDDIYLVSTKDLKGHKVRVMAATKNHHSTPSFTEKTKAYSILFEYMNKIGCKQWFIVDSTYASVPDHFHIIACDEPSDNEDDPYFLKTDKVMLPLLRNNVLIGIPAHNEGATIVEVVSKAKAYGDVLVVDDGSTDDTMCNAISAGATVIRHPSNLGYGAAQKTIFRYALKNNYIKLVTLDGDGQHNPDEIPIFLEALLNADVVVGNRFLKPSNISFFRKIGVSIISKLSKSNDAQCGFRAYNRRAIETIAPLLKDDDMGSSVEILKLAQIKDLEISYVPCTVTYYERPKRRSPVKQAANVLKTLSWVTIWDKPQKYLTLLGLASLFTFIFSTYYFIHLYLLSKYAVISWLLISASSLIVTMLIFNTLVIILVLKNRRDE